MPSPITPPAEPPEIPFRRLQTSLRRVAPHERHVPVRYFVRVYARYAGYDDLIADDLRYGHTLEIGSEEDWFYLAEDIVYPALDPPLTEVWVEFDNLCMRIYPSDEPLAIEILARKINGTLSKEA